MSRFKNYIQIDTDGFVKPRNVGAVTMIGMNYFKTIDIKSNTPPARIPNIIKKHYADNDGTIKFWGKITSYSLIVSNRRAKVFDVDGEFVKYRTGEF